MFSQNIIEEYLDWAHETFPDEDLNGVLIHLEKEINELRDDPEDRFEAVDIAFLLIWYVHLKGWDFDQAMKDKLEILRMRTWAKNDEGVYLHVK